MGAGDRNGFEEGPPGAGRRAGGVRVSDSRGAVYRGAPRHRWPASHARPRLEFGGLTRAGVFVRATLYFPTASWALGWEERALLERLVSRIARGPVRRIDVTGVVNGRVVDDLRMAARRAGAVGSFLAARLPPGHAARVAVDVHRQPASGRAPRGPREVRVEIATAAMAPGQLVSLEDRLAVTRRRSRPER